MPKPSIEALRRELKEKFPRAHHPLPPGTTTGDASQSFDPSCLTPGSLTEVLGPGLPLFLPSLLESATTPSPFPEIALIDSTSAFDPASYHASACSRLLWARCHHPLEMLKAADLLVRDGNLPLILVDASGLTHQSLRSIPSSSWWRLRHTLLQHPSSCLVIMSPLPILPCAHRRLTLQAHLSLDDFSLPRREILPRLMLRQDLLRHAR